MWTGYRCSEDEELAKFNVLKFRGIEEAIYYYEIIKAFRNSEDVLEVFFLVSGKQK